MIDKAEKKRLLKEKTREEIKKIEKHVMEKNLKEKEALDIENHRPVKVRKMQSSINVPDQERRKRELMDSKEIRKNEDQSDSKRIEGKLLLLVLQLLCSWFI